MLLNLAAATSIGTHNLLKKYAPSNRLLFDLLQRTDRYWSLRVSLYSLPYFFGAWIVRLAIEAGGPGWFHLLFLLLFWNGMKFISYWPLDLVRRLIVRARRVMRKVAPEHR